MVPGGREGEDRPALIVPVLQAGPFLDAVPGNSLTGFFRLRYAESEALIWENSFPMTHTQEESARDVRYP